MEYQTNNEISKDPITGTYFESIRNSPPISIAHANKSMREYVTNSSDPIVHRLDYVETNLNKICSQHDALMPLLVLKDQTPAISKNENIIRNLQKKSNENEEKIKSISQKFKEFQRSFETDLRKIYAKKQEKSLEVPNLDKTLKGFSNHINTLQTNLKEIEGKVLNLQRNTENKLKEENNNMNKEIDKMLEVNKNEIQNMLAEFKNKIELALKKELEVYKELKSRKPVSNNFNDYSQDKDKLIEDIHNLTSAKIDNYIEAVKNNYEKEVNELYKDVGGLKCEMEIFNDQRRKEQMMRNLANLPKNTELFEKKVKINNLEQSLFLNELEKFNKENTQRINYELQSLEEKIDGVRHDLISKAKPPKETIIPIKQEIEFLDDRFSQIKYQIEGSKKKYLYDMKRIEEKMDKLNLMHKKIHHEMQKNPQNETSLPKEIEIIESFPEQIKKQMEAINANLELSYKKLKEVDEKLLENKELMKHSP